MAKSVDLSGGKKPDPDLLARVTGKKPQAAPPLPTPPPAGGLAQGFKGKLPLPKNVPVFTPNPDTLTDEERLTLTAIGWQPGEQVTGNVADLIAEVKAANASEKDEEFARLAASAPTRVTVEPVDVNTLDPEQAATVRRRMQETIAAADTAAQEKATAESMIGMPDSVREAVLTARRPAGIEVEDDRPAATAKAAPPPAAAPSTPAAPTDTGLTASHPGNCPHCGWDLAEADDTPTTDGDKITFLHSILGEKSFTKDYPLFGGNVTVTFRSLTGREIDKIYAQVFHEQRKGEVQTGMDFHERINRYRLYLQLVGMKSNTFHHEFPDGFTKETNDTAVETYTLPADLTEGETGLRLVEAHVTRTALKTEIMVRTVTNECRRFNRLVAKLEAVADHPDFWSATGAAP